MSHTTIPNSANRLLAEQAGVITRHQASGCGLTPDALRGLVRDERWTRSERGIYLRGVGAPTFTQRLWIAHLLAGDPSAIGGQAALHRHGVGPEPDEIDVFIPPLPERTFQSPYRFIRDGRDRLAHARGTLPMIRIEDAILDEAKHWSMERFVGAVTDAARLNRTTPQQVERVLRQRERMAKKDTLLAVLADLQGLESNLEFVFRRDVERAHGLPKGARQARKGRSRFDLHYEAWRTIVEVDGRRGHVDGRFRDFRRDNSHASQDVITLRYGSYDIRDDPCALALQVGEALTIRGWDGMVRRCGQCDWRTAS